LKPVLLVEAESPIVDSDLGGIVVKNKHYCRALRFHLVWLPCHGNLATSFVEVADKGAKEL
jgi:hypothetical protein